MTSTTSGLSEEFYDCAFDKMLERLKLESPTCSSFVGPGWVPVVEKCLTTLLEMGWNGKLSQIKEKFCTLRIYLYDYDERLEKIVEEAEKQCESICESCGKERKRVGPKTGSALCNACEKDYLK